MNAPVRYHIIIKTADRHAAGIDSAVMLKMHGEKGSAKPIELGGDAQKKRSRVRSKRSVFAQAVTSQFSVRRPDIGALKSISVWHSAEHAWGLESIVIQRGNDAWTFAPQNGAPVLSQREREDQGLKDKATRLVGEHSTVANGANRFHQAARAGLVDDIEQMITDSEYQIDCTDKLGRTALHYATLYGQIASLEVLLEYQCQLDARDASGKTALHYACQNHVNNIDIIQLLLDNAPDIKADAEDPDAADEDAAADSDTPVERFIRARDGFGKNAMHYAASHGFVQVIRLLDSQCSIALRDKDNTKQTALHCAAIQGQTKAVLELISLGSLVDAPDREDKTFLHHASICGHSDLISQVYEAQFNSTVSKTLETIISKPDAAGRTPLLCAAANAHTATVKTLYRLGSDMFALDNDRSNALHLAARRGSEQILSYLSQKLDLNSTNAYGFTPLHVAVNCNNSASTRWFIKNKADLHATLVTGETPLELAKKKKYESIERSLENAEAMAVQVSKINVLANEIGADPLSESNTTTAPPAIPKLDAHRGHNHAAEAPLIARNDHEVEYVDPNPIPQEFLDAHQSLLAKVEHLEQALIEKNKAIQTYRNKYGALQTNQLNGGAGAGYDRQCADGDCAVM